MKAPRKQHPRLPSQRPIRMYGPRALFGYTGYPTTPPRVRGQAECPGAPNRDKRRSLLPLDPGTAKQLF